ncbi:hypothetical protein [Agreia sp. COWG]|uniref:hypothetical protein n=1 Tax=Agreia sp. COWG TaxID=2773266 RepID=UPI00192791DA|nr:hypothetical protein [Agreia sp. COWG]CAD5990903.1 conserved protein of unknown function [Agreia sp. COWG]
MTLVSEVDERALVRDLLVDAGVAGAENFGRFINDTRYFDGSGFDACAATATLVEVLPSLEDSGVVEIVAVHLKNPAARPSAFVALHDAFLRWGTSARGRVGWQLGEALVHSAPLSELSALLAIVTDSRYGANRQQVVLGLPRFRRAPETEATLRILIHEPEVALQAMYALRRVIGPHQMVDVLEGVRRDHPDTVLARQAKNEIRKIDRVIRRQLAS